MNLAIIEFSAWSGFLIEKLVNKENVIDADKLNDSLWDQIKSVFDSVLFQINLSDITNYPFDDSILLCELLSDNGIVVLNKDLIDITKRNLYSILDSVGLPSLKATRYGDTEESLFIKTNLNWGGELESTFNKSFQQKIKYNPSNQFIKRNDDYRIIKRRDVLEEHFDRYDIVIERYIHNKDDMFYRLYCCGDSIILVHAYNSSPIKKICGDSKDKNYYFTKDDLCNLKESIPSNLLNIINTFISGTTYDYYSLDIVYDDKGNYYIIDINTTPYLGRNLNIYSLKIFDFLKLGLQRRILNRRLNIRNELNS